MPVYSSVLNHDKEWGHLTIKKSMQKQLKPFWSFMNQELNTVTSDQFSLMISTILFYNKSYSVYNSSDWSLLLSFKITCNLSDVALIWLHLSSIIFILFVHIILLSLLIVLSLSGHGLFDSYSGKTFFYLTQMNFMTQLNITWTESITETFQQWRIILPLISILPLSFSSHLCRSPFGPYRVEK